MIYMIAGEGVVKIGYANDPRRRLSELQVGHARPLVVMRVFEGGAAEEAKLHEMFADVRTRGEWFTFRAAMLGDVGLVEIPVASLAKKPATPPPPVTTDDEGFGPFRDGLIRIFGSLKDAVLFMDTFALPWIKLRLSQAPSARPPVDPDAA